MQYDSSGLRESPECETSKARFAFCLEISGKRFSASLYFSRLESVYP
jgi:hypothetical protein